MSSRNKRQRFDNDNTNHADYGNTSSSKRSRRGGTYSPSTTGGENKGMTPFFTTSNATFTPGHLQGSATFAKPPLHSGAKQGSSCTKPTSLKTKRPKFDFEQFGNDAYANAFEKLPSKTYTPMGVRAICTERAKQLNAQRNHKEQNYGWFNVDGKQVKLHDYITSEEIKMHLKHRSDVILKMQDDDDILTLEGFLDRESEVCPSLLWHQHKQGETMVLLPVVPTGQEGFNFAVQATVTWYFDHKVKRTQPCEREATMILGHRYYLNASHLCRSRSFQSAVQSCLDSCFAAKLKTTKTSINEQPASLTFEQSLLLKMVDAHKEQSIAQAVAQAEIAKKDNTAWQVVANRYVINQEKDLEFLEENKLWRQALASPGRSQLFIPPQNNGAPGQLVYPSNNPAPTWMKAPVPASPAASGYASSSYGSPASSNQATSSQSPSSQQHKKQPLFPALSGTNLFGNTARSDGTMAMDHP